MAQGFQGVGRQAAEKPCTRDLHFRELMSESDERGGNMKLAIIRGAQQILRDISRPGTGEVLVDEFANWLGVDLAAMEAVIEGIRLELASREREADFVLHVGAGRLKVERRAGRRGVFRTQGGVEPNNLTIEEREKMMEQIIAEIPEKLKGDALGKEGIVKALKSRTQDELSAIISSAYFISCEQKNVTFWQAVMQRMKDVKDDDKWNDRINEAKLIRQKAEAVVRKIPISAIRYEIQNGQLLGRGILPSIAKAILENAKKE